MRVAILRDTDTDKYENWRYTVEYRVTVHPFDTNLHFLFSKILSTIAQSYGKNFFDYPSVWSVKNLSHFYTKIVVFLDHIKIKSLKRDRFHVTVHYYIRIVKGCTKRSKMAKMGILVLEHFIKLNNVFGAVCSGDLFFK